MPLYALTCVNTDEDFVSHFPIRTADNRPDYVVALLLGGQGDMSTGVWHGFLSDVVLRHVYCLEPSSVSVVRYHPETDSVVLADSNPSRIAIPEDDNNTNRRGWAKNMIDSDRKEQPTADTYVVSVFKIMSNLAVATSGVCVWDIIESEIKPPCPRRQLVDLTEDDGTLAVAETLAAVEDVLEAIDVSDDSDSDSDEGDDSGCDCGCEGDDEGDISESESEGDVCARAVMARHPGGRGLASFGLGDYARGPGGRKYFYTDCSNAKRCGKCANIDDLVDNQERPAKRHSPTNETD
jgi:hypothetical protein